MYAQNRKNLTPLPLVRTGSIPLVRAVNIISKNPKLFSPKSADVSEELSFVRKMSALDKPPHPDCGRLLWRAPYGENLSSVYNCTQSDLC